MEIKQLNCAACGAPIRVPEGVEQLNCAACGSFLAVQRGEGYVALKMVEKVAQAIQESGYVTQAELKKLQFTQELSMLEMQLSAIRGEVRGLERGQATPKTSQQIKELHFQEYELIERMRQRHAAWAAGIPAGTAQELEALEGQLKLVHAELEALDGSMHTRQIGQTMDSLQQEALRLAGRILAIRSAALKQKLRSYHLKTVEGAEIERITAELEAVEADLHTLEGRPGSPEVKAIKAELLARRGTLLLRWKALENERIAAALRSGQFSVPDGQDLATARSQLEDLRADIAMLAGWQQSAEVAAQLASLRKREKAFARELTRLEGRQGGVSVGEAAAGAGCLAALGLGGLAAAIGGALSRWLTPKARPESAPAPEPAAPAPGLPLSVGKGCTAALALVVVFTIVSAVLMVALFPGESEASQGKDFGFFMGGVWLGFVLAAGVFFRALNGALDRTQPRKRVLYAVLAGAAVLVGVWLFFLSVLGFANPQSEYATMVISAGLCLGPLAAVVSGVVMMKRSQT